MVVLAILAMISAAFPVMLNHAVPGRRIAVTAERIRSLFRDAAMESTRRGVPVSVRLSEGALQVTVPGTPDRTILELPVPASVDMSLRGAMGQSASSMTLFPDGSGDGAEVDLTDRGHHWRVRRSALTGRVSAEAVQ
jgi:Tfp pilus assembly protein FimT